MAMLASASVQEAQDLALIADATTLRTRVPFIHFFDGVRTSHEVAKIEALATDTIDALIDDTLVHEHRRRALSPDRPVLRGTAQNPDVFFQSREPANLFDYSGAPDAERVLVVMGSAAGPCREWVDRAVAKGEKVGLIVVRLYRPFDSARFVEALPSSARSVAVLDRTKEPGAVGAPLLRHWFANRDYSSLTEARGSLSQRSSWNKSTWPPTVKFCSSTLSKVPSPSPPGVRLTAPIGATSTKLQPSGARPGPRCVGWRWRRARRLARPGWSRRVSG